MTRKVNIAFFIDSLNCGGAERSLVSLLQKLDYTRFNVDLYAWNANGIFSRLLPPKVRLHIIPERKDIVGRLWNKLSHYWYSVLIRLVPMLGIKRHNAELYWSAIHSALPKLKAEYDVAVSYQQGFMTYYVADKVKASQKIAWINSQLSGHNHRESFSRPFYDKFDNIVCVSDHLYDILSKSQYLDPKRLITIYDMLNVDVIQGMATESIEQLRDNDRQIIIVTVARLTPPKNLPLAINAASLLVSRGFDIKWVIVGGGVIYSKLKEQIERLGLDGKVILVGEKANPYPYINAADIYAQTSSFEGFGLTIAEAKILHKPVVSTDFSVVYDQIKDGVNGLIAHQTPEDVADKIQMLIVDETLRGSIIKAVSTEHNTTALTEVAKFYSLLRSPHKPDTAGPAPSDRSLSIAIITCNNAVNYGARLQAYALQQYLSSIGHDVRVIDYEPSYMSFSQKRWYNPGLSPKEWAKLLVRYPQRSLDISKHQRLERFSHRYLNLTRKYQSLGDLQSKAPIADIYIAGSDQIWNVRFANGHDPAFYLDFGQAEVRRLSYAASFALDKLPAEDIDNVKRLLANIDDITVRETSAVDIVNAMGYDATLVCDPVFLLSAAEWGSFADNEGDGIEYLLVYDFMDSDDLRQVAQKIARLYNLKIYSVSPRHMRWVDRNYSDCAAETFVALFSNARIVVSNSLHGTIFSLIFRKDFFVVNRDDGLNVRMSDQLTSLGLSHRIISAETDDDILAAHIDYKAVDSLLTPLIDESKRHLRAI